MPWKEACVGTERTKFIAELMEKKESFAETCRRFGISRRSGYKWVERFNGGGPAGLEDRPHVALHQEQRTAVEVVEAVLACRREHRLWGPKKIKGWLQDHRSELAVPAVSTIGEMLKRHGMVRVKRYRPRVPVTQTALGHAVYANDIWAIDFKGNFLLLDKSRCYPLTVTDQASRFLLTCYAMSKPRMEPVKEQLKRVFSEFGLPNKMRSDNGPPFASIGAGGLSALSVWWIRLGIELERIEPGHPEQNGQHERFHRTLKDETTPKANCAEQQRAFDQFRGCFNNERPHEALGQKPPAQFYSVSQRSYPTLEKSPEYDAGQSVRWIDSTGGLKWKGKRLPLAGFLANEPVGIEQTREDVWQVRYGVVLLGELRLRDKAVQFAPAT
jgi:putative transposase